LQLCLTSILKNHQPAPRISNCWDHLQRRCNRNGIRRWRPPRQTDQDEFGNDVQLHQILDDLSLARPDPWGTKDRPQSKAPHSCSVAASSNHN
jgi:hypothetical protein